MFSWEAVRYLLRVFLTRWWLDLASDSAFAILHE
jgi:hypothetical protein